MSTSQTIGFPPGAGAGSNCRPVRHTRNHAGALLWLLLLVPLAAQGTAPDREYMDKLAQHLSRKLPGLTADEIVVSVQPSCPAEQVGLCAVRSNVFGSSTLTLRCAGSNSLPFTAAITTKLPKSQRGARKVPILRRGSRVRLEVASQGLEIVTTASALASGDIGDSIPVRTARTNRVLRAEVIDSFTVRAFLGESQQ